MMIACAVCLTPACGNDDDENSDSDQNPDPVTEVVVYATGADGTQGVYWRNGEATTLKSPISETPKWTRGKSIAVVDDVVYVAGYENKTAILWKDGEPTALTDNTVELSVNDLAVVGEDTYIVGAYGGAGVYWKNNTMIELTSYGEIRSIYVDGTDIYMSGNDNGIATYWKNGTPVALSKDQWSASEGYGITVVDGTVIVSGYYDAEAAVWTCNGSEVTEQLLTEDWNYAQCRGVAYDVENKVAYSVGNDGYNPVYWVNGQMTTLATCSSFGTATDICFHDQTCYIGGIEDYKAVIWVDGQAEVLAEAKTGPSIYALCVVEEEVAAEQ